MHRCKEYPNSIINGKGELVAGQGVYYAIIWVLKGGRE